MLTICADDKRRRFLRYAATIVFHVSRLICYAIIFRYERFLLRLRFSTLRRCYACRLRDTRAATQLRLMPPHTLPLMPITFAAMPPLLRFFFADLFSPPYFSMLERFTLLISPPCHFAAALPMSFFADYAYDYAKERRVYAAAMRLQVAVAYAVAMPRHAPPLCCRHDMPFSAIFAVTLRYADKLSCRYMLLARYGLLIRFDDFRWLRYSTLPSMPLILFR